MLRPCANTHTHSVHTDVHATAPAESLDEVIDSNPYLTSLDLTSCRGISVRERRNYFEVGSSSRLFEVTPLALYCILVITSFGSWSAGPNAD